MSTTLEISLPRVPEATAGSRTPSSVDGLFHDYEDRIFRRTDRCFQILLVVQWFVALVFAVVVSPQAWEGSASHVHPHVIAAVLMGGAFCVFPLTLSIKFPGQAITRHVMAVSQVGFSTLLIHLTGGRIETHFHVFGSLAFIALYRDWRVLLTATVVVACDHLLRGMWFPQSVYGVAYATPWRTLEHAGWVVFEDIVLIWSCLVARRDMRDICEKEHQNRDLLDDLENRVKDRTRDLESEVSERKWAEEQLRKSEERHRNLVTNAPVGIFQTTHEGKVMLANPHLLSMMGYESPEEMNQLSLERDLYASPNTRRRFWDKLHADGQVRGFEAELVRRDGRHIHVVQNARLIREPVDGTILCSEGTVEEITERKEAEEKVRALNAQLLEASRQAGMAEVATGVLHNVGNVLNSINVSVSVIQDRLEKSRLPLLRKSTDLLQEHKEDLPGFFARDTKARALPEFLVKLADHLEEAKRMMQLELGGLAGNIEHIKQVVTMQQNYARVFGVMENLLPESLANDAINLIASGFDRHHIELVRDFEPAPTVLADRHKVLQILINLLRNAKHATQDMAPEQRRIVVAIRTVPGNRVQIGVRDTGVGISGENMAKIFRHGFTTKQDGHGFGLHASVLAAREMQGDLTVHSDGPGLGAVFTLELPISPPTSATP